MYESRRNTAKYIYLLDWITVFFALFIDVWLMDDGRHQPPVSFCGSTKAPHDEP
ncbi:hypothetical protein C4K23_3282 [Pseudomonas chlororaphis]|nr:hypothetical protein C4K23_3282 [Pseudomonas chlororaphis]